MSPISHRGTAHQRLHEDHLSLSEQASPSKNYISSDSPTDAIKFMVALLSLENTMLRADIRHKSLSVALQNIAFNDLKTGGRDYRPEQFEQLTKDLQYYQAKTMELELELSRRRKKDPEATASVPLPAKEKSIVIEQYHDKENMDNSVLRRHQAYYDKKVYNVRNRSLLYHSIVRWLDLSRTMNADSDMKQTLAYMAFAKWKLKASYKVFICNPVTSYRRRPFSFSSNIHKSMG